MSAAQPARRNPRPKKRELFCPAHPGQRQKNFLNLLQPEQLQQCSSSHWCHVIKDDQVTQTVRWAPRALWEQVAHVDPTATNPTVSDYTRRSARRTAIKRVDGKSLFD